MAKGNQFTKHAAKLKSEFKCDQKIQNIFFLKIVDSFQKKKDK
jgi:hypothetical protein